MFLDALIGDVWEYELSTGAIRNLTETFLPGGVLWPITSPTATCSCAWNPSSIGFNAVPEVFVEPLAGDSQVFTGRIVYGSDGVPTIADRTMVLDKLGVSPDTPAVEAQDFRSLDDGDADPDDELIFIFPGMPTSGACPLDGPGAFERVTTFDHYAGLGANNPVVSPDGTSIAFSRKVEGEQGEGNGILLLHLTAPADVDTAAASPDPAASPATGPAPLGPGCRPPARRGPAGRWRVGGAVLLNCLRCAPPRPRRPWRRAAP